MNKPRTWDLGLDYQKMYKQLVKQLRSHLSRKAFTSYCYCSVLLIQLRNGSRISEALESAKLFIETGDRIVWVRVRKRKDDYKRKMLLPKELKPNDLTICRDILADPKALNRIKVYAKKVLRINTHSLRYAYITYLLKNGVNPSIVAKVTGHKTLDHILTYTQQRSAEEVLEQLG